MRVPSDGEPVTNTKAKPAWARRVTIVQTEDEGEGSNTEEQPEPESVWANYTAVSRFPAASEEDNEEIPGGGVSN